MTEHRNESESLRARVRELESKLASAEAESARLRGETPQTATAESKPSALVGEPLHHVSERELDFEIDESGYEAVAAMLRERRKVQVAQVGRSLGQASRSPRAAA